jgi:glutamate-1-semialdehyde aminotransferase
MFGYIVGAGAAVGMPAGSNNQNAFMLGLTSQYLNGTTSTLKRRTVSAYSTLGSLPHSPFATRLVIPGVVLAPARIGPAPAFFPNRNGQTSSTVTLPY